MMAFWEVLEDRKLGLVRKLVTGGVSPRARSYSGSLYTVLSAAWCKCFYSAMPFHPDGLTFNCGLM